MTLEYDDGYDDEDDDDYERNEDEFLAEQMMTKEEYIRLQCIKASAIVNNGRSQRLLTMDSDVIETAQKMLNFIKDTD